MKMTGLIVAIVVIIKFFIKNILMIFGMAMTTNMFMRMMMVMGDNAMRKNNGPCQQQKGQYEYFILYHGSKIQKYFPFI